MIADGSRRNSLDALPMWSVMRARWQGAGLHQLADTCDRKFASFALRYNAGQIGVVLYWLDALNEEDPVCTLAVVDCLDTLLSHVGPEGLGRWMLTGLRLYPGEQARRRGWFQLADPVAVEALHKESGAGDLAVSLRSLALLLNGLAGIHIALQLRNQNALNGLPLRPVLTLGRLLVPDDYTALDGNSRYRIYRAAVAHAVAHLRFSTPAMPANALKPMSIALVSAIEDARVERLLIRDCPGVKGWFLEFLRRGVRPQDLDFSALLGRMNLALMDACYEDDNYWVNKARRLFEAQAGDLNDYAAFRKLASILANDLGQMRVPFSLHFYLVPEVYRDDNSFLWDFVETDSESPILVAPQMQSPLGQGLDSPQDPFDAHSVIEVEGARYLYPEWDCRISLMRIDWCTVIEKRPEFQGRSVPFPPGDGGAANSQLVPMLRSQNLSRSRSLRRQWEGDDIDLNAAIEVMVDQRMDLAPEPRMFLRVGSEERASSVLTLLDLSESTNAHLGSSVDSILETEKKASLLLARSVLLRGDRIAVHGFSSNTRAEVNYYRLLEFGAPLDADATRRIHSVAGRYSTRLGAALRHATSCIVQEQAERRAILLVSDGAPSDIDVYESRYLIDDARKAVLEAGRSGVDIFCVALDPEAESYVRKVFGYRNYCVVDDPLRLSAQLYALYTRMTIY
ncbi:nitric oxide reductase activation protein NorD [Pseudomonas corrugata]|uniref:nitric oxide reductase activation protein NorD n=1 Tax=Pseudomonas corrugata TaxID=47879 RepID=UPI000B2ECDD0|nr:hypothetical protein [Pseudomonas corrugata]